MKVSLLWVFVLVLSVAHPKAIKAQNSSPTTQKVYQLLDKYSPESAALIRLLYRLPSSFEFPEVVMNLSNEQAVDVWVSEPTEKGIITSLNTVVHESMHGLTSRLPYELILKNDNLSYKMDDEYSAFYVNKDSIFLVKHSPVFNSNKISNEIPKALRTFRYKPYISPKSANLGSQVNGIYGLMDEWNAYYFGTQTSYDLFEYFQSKSSSNYEVYLEHISNLAGTYYAYYEFKYFMLKYLEFAKTNERVIFDGIMANTELRKAYNSIDDRYTQLLLAIEKRFDEIAVLPSANTKDSVYKEDGYYFINETGVGLFLEEIKLLKTELNKPGLKNMAAEFRFR